MHADRLSRFTRWLGAVVGGGFFVLGVAELVMRLEKPLVLLFWLPTLWGGATLVLTGVFRRGAPPQLAVVLVILGSVLGGVASAWTVLMPVLALVLVSLMIVRMDRLDVELENTPAQR